MNAFVSVDKSSFAKILYKSLGASVAGRFMQGSAFKIFERLKK